jgi:hypothetical protein
MLISKSMKAAVALLGFAMPLAAGLSAHPAAAQTIYACPPGYYYLANYGCYPFGGYRYVAPPVYPYPVAPYPYVAPWGLSFRFGDGDRDFHGDRGFHGGHR